MTATFRQNQKCSQRIFFTSGILKRSLPYIVFLPPTPITFKYFEVLAWYQYPVSVAFHNHYPTCICILFSWISFFSVSNTSVWIFYETYCLSLPQLALFNSRVWYTAHLAPINWFWWPMKPLVRLLFQDYASCLAYYLKEGGCCDITYYIVQLDGTTLSLRGRTWCSAARINNRAIKTTAWCRRYYNNCIQDSSILLLSFCAINIQHYQSTPRTT